MRNLLAHVPKQHKDMVAATVRLIFAEHDADAARARLRQVVSMLEARFPKVAQLLVDAEADVTPTPPSPNPTSARSPAPTPSSGSTKR